MKNTLSVLLLFTALGSVAQPVVCDYAYVRNGSICVYSNALKQQYLVAVEGLEPAISPDGTRVAYTERRANGECYIVIYLLGSKKNIVLNTHNSNCYGAVWSPDGRMLAYNALLSHKWKIGVIKSDNTGAQILAGTNDDVYSPVWTSDSKKVMVQDSKSLEYIDMSGKVSLIMPLSKLEGGMPELKGMVGSSSDDRFVFTTDKSQIVFCSATNGGSQHDGPMDALFIYNVRTGKTIYLSKKEYDAGYLALKGKQVFFSTAKFNGSTVDIAEENLNGTNYKILFPGCTDISVRQ